MITRRDRIEAMDNLGKGVNHMVKDRIGVLVNLIWYIYILMFILIMYSRTNVA